MKGQYEIWSDHYLIEAKLKPNKDRAEDNTKESFPKKWKTF